VVTAWGVPQYPRRGQRYQCAGKIVMVIAPYQFDRTELLRMTLLLLEPGKFTLYLTLLDDIAVFKCIGDQILQRRSRQWQGHQQ